MFGKKTVSVEGRTFSILAMKLQNGCFIAITEAEHQLGSLTVSLYGSNAPVTTDVIPSKSRSLFTRLAAERLAFRTGGIGILSVSVQSDIPADTAKEIMMAMDEMAE